MSYCAIESFGSIFVSLFWSFVNSSVSLEHAKASYGLIIAGAQVGAILGPTLVVMSNVLGVANLYVFGGAVVGLVWVLMKKYVSFYGVGRGINAGGAKPDKGATGLVEGLWLLLKHPYVMGIFAITCLFEVVVTVLDFEMKVIAKKQPQYVKAEDFARFMGFFGQATNSVSLFFSLVGTSFVIRRLGLSSTLMLFPTMLMAVLSYVMVYPSLDVFFFALVTVKGLSYALNKPSVEMLYFATSDTIKFKSKSWSDVFGARCAKAFGSVITDSLRCARRGARGAAGAEPARRARQHSRRAPRLRPTRGRARDAQVLDGGAADAGEPLVDRRQRCATGDRAADGQEIQRAAGDGRGDWRGQAAPRRQGRGRAQGSQLGRQRRGVGGGAVRHQVTTPGPARPRPRDRRPSVPSAYHPVPPPPPAPRGRRGRRGAGLAAAVTAPQRVTRRHCCDDAAIRSR